MMIRFRSNDSIAPLRLVLCLFTILGLCSAATTAVPEATALLPGDERLGQSSNCETEGDEGLYGIGVRAGIYLQVFASMFTLSFQPDQGPAFLYAAAALQAALFVALVYASARDEIQSSEALIAMLLLIVMILFEVLVFSSISIHLMSGHFRLANEEEPRQRADASIPDPTLLPSIRDSNASSTSINKCLSESRQKRVSSKESANEQDEIISLRGHRLSGQSLTRQKTRIAQPTNPAEININEALYNSDPLLIDDENLRMLAKVVNNYSGDHAWVSAILITLLVLGCYSYMLWFWWTGMDQMKKSPCGSLGFFVVATFDIHHWIRWVVRVFLILAGLAVLGLLYQCVSASAGFCMCLMFQFGGDTQSRRSSAVQRMKEFFDRVAMLNLPPSTEYLLLILVFKSFIMHSPERIFVGWIRRLQKRKQDEKDATEVASAVRRTSRRQEYSNSKDASRRQGDDKDPLDTEIEINGTRIDYSKFFKVSSRRFSLPAVSNKLISWLLKPQPRQIPSPDDTERNCAESARFIMPYADNFDTITINVMILFGHLTYFTIVGILLAAGIWSVELTISKNHIIGVNHLPSAAQLIPFIIGLGSFCQSGISALGALWVWLWGIIRLRRGSESWFEALTGRLFYESTEDEGGVNVEYLRHFPLMLVIWMLFPTMRKGQSIYDFRKDFWEEMNERGGFFALDLLD